MATVLDAPSALGNYMLKGWVLTNNPCPNTACRVPLLRSPHAQSPVVHLCVSCSAEAASTSSTSTSQMTRPSTPATEVSEISDDLPPFVETAETRRRREQTDRASAEIGRRLLQGWTMLGDECPRDACYYVPLVRSPKTGGEEEPKKECVLCGNIYTTRRDRTGREQLVSVNVGSSSQTVPPTADPQSSVMPSQRERYPHHVAEPSGTSPLHPLIPTLNTQDSVAVKTTQVTSIAGTLDSSAEALRLSLQNLTSRLTSLTSNPTLADPASIAATADAISKVTQALSQVKQLQWSEAHAHAMS